MDDKVEPFAGDEGLASEFKAPKLPTVQSQGETLPTKEGEEDRQLQKFEKKPLKSPAESLKVIPPLPYKEPSWSGLCSQKYSLEVIKNGVPVEEIALSSKPFWVVGRLPQCDMCMEHPSLSRYHAVIQFCAVPTEQHPVGWFLFDLGSTHGTTLNKRKVSSNTYHRLRVGYTFKFGGSTRLHILQGPDEDQENEVSTEELTALREKRKAQLEEKLRLRAEAEKDSTTAENESGGCSWGIDDDAEEVDPNAVNPFSSEVGNEELYLDDPKKSLRGWFEREGYDEPEYMLEEQSHGRYKCTVELPVDTPTGHPLKAEVSVQGKKKEAVVQCALEACRILDKQGVLRQAKHESRKRKTRNWDENDYYDSDDDTFLDRTGDVEKKRQLRMKRAGKLEEKSQAILTYEQLVEQLVALETEMTDIQTKLDRSKQLEKEREAEMDDLDAYMMSIKSGGMNATEKTRFKRRMIELKQDKMKTEKLINIAKPNSLIDIRKGIEKKLQTDSITKATSAPPPIKVVTNSQETKSTDSVEAGLNVASNDTSMELPDADQMKKCDTNTSVNNNGSTTVTSTKGLDSSNTELVNSMDTSDYNKSVNSSKSKSKRSKGKDKQTESPAVSDGHIQATAKPPATATAAPSLSSMVSTLKNKEEENQLLNDPDYAGWLPPKDQSGDGRTSLNDKLGY